MIRVHRTDGRKSAHLVDENPKLIDATRTVVYSASACPHVFMSNPASK